MSKKISKIINISIDGVLAATNGYFALEILLKNANMKAAVFQEYLSRAPELTEKVYQTAQTAIERVSSGDFYTGLACAAVAGIFGGLAIYDACKKEE